MSIGQATHLLCLAITATLAVKFFVCFFLMPG
jgi:hypothetical protein